MSKVTISIDIEFKGDGQEREGLCVNLTLHQDNPSDDQIAQAIYDEVTQHLYENPRDADEVKP